MILEPIIEQKQEEICNYCEINIIDGCSNTQFYQCEGRFCEQATEQFFEEHPEKNNYEFTYHPSKRIKDLIQKLDDKISLLIQNNDNKKTKDY